MKISAVTWIAFLQFAQMAGMLICWTAGATIWYGRVAVAGSFITLLIWIRHDYQMAKFRRDMGDIEAWVRREAEKRARGQ